MHFWELATRVPPGCLAPSKYGTNGCIPAVVNKAVGSFSGTSEAEGIIVCPFLLKNSKNLKKKKKKKKKKKRARGVFFLFNFPLFFFFFFFSKIVPPRRRPL